MGAGMIVEDGTCLRNAYREGPLANNLRLVGNTFDGTGAPQIQMKSCGTADGGAGGSSVIWSPLRFKNITMHQNSFSHVDGSPTELTGIDGLSFEGNEVKQIGPLSEVTWCIVNS